MNRNNLMTNQTFLINWWQEHDGYMLSQVEFNDPPTSFTRPSLRGVLEILPCVLFDSFPYIFLKEVRIKVVVGKKYILHFYVTLRFSWAMQWQVQTKIFITTGTRERFDTWCWWRLNTSWETGQPYDSCLTQNIWFLSLDFYTCHKQYNHPRPASLFHR